MKKLFQYSIYPVFMLSASFLIIRLMESGTNQYLATVPIIALFGLIALLLERWLPFEKNWVNGTDWNLDFTYYIVNYLIKVSAQFALVWLAVWIPFPQWFPNDGSVRCSTESLLQLGSSNLKFRWLLHLDPSLLWLSRVTQIVVWVCFSIK